MARDYVPDHEEWESWLINPVTRHFIRCIQQMEIKERVENRNFTEQETLIKDFFYSEGICYGYSHVLEFIKDKKEKN